MGLKLHRGFESLSLRQSNDFKYAPVAQLDRVPGYEPGGREFESLRARQFFKGLYRTHRLQFIPETLVTPLAQKGAASRLSEVS